MNPDPDVDLIPDADPDPGPEFMLCEIREKISNMIFTHTKNRKIKLSC